MAEVVEALRLAPGDTLLDPACGLGGYGLEIAVRTEARLVGIDFSAEAVRQAGEQARRLGRTADFRKGDLAATGLDAGSIDAVLCVDAIQWAGFDNVEVRGHPAWRARERAMWEEARAVDPGDDSALQSFHDEGVRSLEIFNLIVRCRMASSSERPRCGRSSQDSASLHRIVVLRTHSHLPPSALGL